MMLARDNINNAFNNNRGMNIRNNQFLNPMNTNNYNTNNNPFGNLVEITIMNLIIIIRYLCIIEMDIPIGELINP